MGKIIYGRSKADLSKAGDEFVVFLIGARINIWWKVHQWLPVARSMGPMLRELQAHPEWGLLGCEGWVGRITLMVQYWRSMAHLMSYARGKSHLHLPAWQAFNKRAQCDAIGLWHEAYVVRPAEIHSTYVNMPRFGLAQVAERFGEDALHERSLDDRAAA